MIHIHIEKTELKRRCECWHKRERAQQQRKKHRIRERKLQIIKKEK